MPACNAQMESTGLITLQAETVERTSRRVVTVRAETVGEIIGNRGRNVHRLSLLFLD